MKSDARLVLNKKKWRKGGSGVADNRIPDARKILNLKRKKTPAVGSYMRTKTATAFIASQIRKEIHTQVPGKRVELSKDGNIIVTSKSSNSWVRGKTELPRNSHLSRNRLQQNVMETEDLEHTAIEDLLDLESLPATVVSSATVPSADLSRKSVLGHVLDNRYTMVADQLSQPSTTSSTYKVYVSNLDPGVSRQDIVELFGEIGMMKSVEMFEPGTAIIDFYNQADAHKACHIYHNRLLDGLPMKCCLQNSFQSERSAISQRLGNGVTLPLQRPVTNPRSRYNPRNVQFTVKLT